MDQSIFKAYDVRGIYPDQFDEQDAYDIARGYATWLKKQNPDVKKVVVASDARLSGPALREKVIKGILDTGLDVDDIGLASTPTFYFAVSYYGYDGGIQITASHNPKEYNGLKIVKKNAFPLSGNYGLPEVKEIVLNKGYFVPEKSGNLGIRKNVLDDEIKQQAGGFAGIKYLKIVIDTSNGVAALDFEALATELPCEVVKMNFDLDGNFPGHGPNPMSAEGIKALSEKVLAEGAGLGIALDADGDRIGFVDEKGEEVPQAILRGIMSQIEIAEHPGALVAYDIRPGKITKDMIDEVGGKSIVTPVGHSLIKDIMVREGAIFGGESSGHYCYKFDDGTYEAPIFLVVKFLKYFSKQDKPLSEVVAPLKKYFITSELNYRIESREKGLAIIELLKTHFADGQQNLLDGLSVEYPNYWFLVRLSNTEPLLRLTIEARSPEELAAAKAELEKIITK